MRRPNDDQSRRPHRPLGVGYRGRVTPPTESREAASDLRAQLDALREVLRAISVSPFDLEGVLGIVVERMAKLCDADIGMIYLPAGEGSFKAVAGYAVNPTHAEYERSHPTPVTEGTMVGRVVLSGRAVQIEDTATDPSYTWTVGRQVGGFRTLLGVPIRKQTQLIGTVGLARLDVRPFSTDEIELVQTFADQAAIVIDTVRLGGTIDRQREELARYLPSTVAELVSAPDGEQLLAGHRREVTAVFCDLRGFTSFAEAAEPEEVLDVVREYHRELGAIIVAHGGTLEHFAGDGMMIFLNDPKPVADHPAEAVRMAVEMRDRFATLSERWRRLGFELGLGIGISVGHATLGRIGFEGHFGYAVIGSVANLAARLCAIAEPDQIVLSERVYVRVEAMVVATPLGAMELKGFRRPVDSYTLVKLAAS
jgi:class 3 adenylate cyclase